VRQLQLRFHPDRALSSLAPLFNEITKEINSMTADI